MVAELCGDWPDWRDWTRGSLSTPNRYDVFSQFRNFRGTKGRNGISIALFLRLHHWRTVRASGEIQIFIARGSRSHEENRDPTSHRRKLRVSQERETSLVLFLIPLFFHCGPVIGIAPLDVTVPRRSTSVLHLCNNGKVFIISLIERKIF